MSAPSLATLATRIEAAHQAAYQAARTALDHALEAGRLLLEAKGALPHGGWLPWLAEHTTVGPRQAQRYMRLASASIEGKCVGKSHLTIEGALAALAAPNADKAEPDRVPRTVYLAESRPLDDGEIRMQIADVLPAPAKARRTEVYPAHIQMLAKYLNNLPPIEINQRNELIDGWHRLEAHKLAGAKTITAVVTEVESERHHLELFCMRNCGSTQGTPYTLEDEAYQDRIAERFGGSLADVRERASAQARTEWWERRHAETLLAEVARLEPLQAEIRDAAAAGHPLPAHAEATMVDTRAWIARMEDWRRARALQDLERADQALRDAIAAKLHAQRAIVLLSEAAP